MRTNIIVDYSKKKKKKQKKTTRIVTIELKSIVAFFLGSIFIQNHLGLFHIVHPKNLFSRNLDQQSNWNQWPALS